MIRKISFAALAVVVSASATAASDSRIRTLAYSADQIVRIVGKAGIQSTIEFAADERIENVAVGDSAAWQITPNRRASLLFVKPLNGHSRTNMTVVTDKRTYMFDLVSGEKSAAPIYALKFSYPNEKIEAPVKTAQPVVQASVQAPATITADKLHFDWKSKGYDKLVPDRIFDDGRAVYLSWRHDTPLPAILTMSEDRREGPVNYRMSGEYIVVSPIPQNLLLRYGKKSAVLWPTRRIVPAPAAPANAVAGRMAESQPQPAPVQPVPVQSPPPSTSQHQDAAAGSLRLANVTALYSDKLTDDHHEQ